ncbi:MAG: hypothetical protein HQ472_06535 [Ignavibacteria bacterium]|nr:hypothetical protein [Ignavibacteria bacterium]
MNIDRYRSLRAFRALLHGVFQPQNVYKATTDSAMAIFAIAVLVLTIGSAASYMAESNNAQLKTETELMKSALNVDKNSTKSVPIAENNDVTLAVGNSLFIWAGGLLVLSLLFLVLGRFMLDLTVNFKMTLASVGSTAIILLSKELFNSILHVSFGTIQYGAHLGAFWDPVQSPILFSWLQRIDIFSLWAFLNCGAALVGWGGLHKKFGYAIGFTAWVITVCAFGVISVLAGILAQL